MRSAQRQRAREAAEVVAGLGDLGADQMVDDLSSSRREVDLAGHGDLLAVCIASEKLPIRDIVSEEIG